mmetsp:Transcript_31143/g.67358  ORF Transcript_31143/g.67358 Transcript_31143/m.67358 type:complete len:158 (+) Transcript_31143:78-551(+)
MLSSDQQSREAKWQLRFSFVSILISSIFWIWAILNTTKSKSFDLGIVSFLSVLIAHTVILCNLRKQQHRINDGLQQEEQSLQPSSKCASYTILGTHLFVTLNYFLGLCIAIGTDMIDDVERRIRFAIYCGIATVLWFSSAIVGCRLFNPRYEILPQL